MSTEKLGYVLDGAVFRFWPEKERIALLRFLYEVYQSDFTYSQDEKSDFDSRAKTFGVAPEEVEKMPLEEAMRILGTDRLKEDLAYIVIADAIFADGDYDKTEKRFIRKVVQKYGLQEKRLAPWIRRIQQTELAKVLEAWAEEIARNTPEVKFD